MSFRNLLLSLARPNQSQPADLFRLHLRSEPRWQPHHLLPRQQDLLPGGHGLCKANLAENQGEIVCCLDISAYANVKIQRQD